MAIIHPITNFSIASSQGAALLTCHTEGMSILPEADGYLFGMQAIVLNGIDPGAQHRARARARLARLRARERHAAEEVAALLVDDALPELPGWIEQALAVNNAGPLVKPKPRRQRAPRPLAAPKSAAIKEILSANPAARTADIAAVVNCSAQLVQKVRAATLGRRRR